jgi:hypothetical protein
VGERVNRPESEEKKHKRFGRLVLQAGWASCLIYGMPDGDGTIDFDR